MENLKKKAQLNKRKGLPIFFLSCLFFFLTVTSNLQTGWGVSLEVLEVLKHISSPALVGPEGKSCSYSQRKEAMRMQSAQQ